MQITVRFGLLVDCLMAYKQPQVISMVKAVKERKLGYDTISFTSKNPKHSFFSAQIPRLKHPLLFMIIKLCALRKDRNVSQSHTSVTALILSPLPHLHTNVSVTNQTNTYQTFLHPRSHLFQCWNRLITWRNPCWLFHNAHLLVEHIIFCFNWT